MFKLFYISYIQKLHNKISMYRWINKLVMSREMIKLYTDNIEKRIIFTSALVKSFEIEYIYLKKKLPLNKKLTVKTKIKNFS